MKTSGWVVAVLLAAGGLILQGCASSGDVHYAPGAAPQAQASPASSKVVTGITDKSSFEAVRAAIEKEMQAKGRFSSVAPAGQATVNGRFRDMAALFDQYGSIDKMDPAAMARIDSDQNAINAVLAPHDGNRLICEQETQVGSHFPKRVCRKLSELQNRNTGTEQFMRQMQSPPTQGSSKTGGP